MTRPSDTVASSLGRAIDGFEPVRLTGKVVEAVGTVLRVAGMRASVGQLCELLDPSGNSRLGEVVGFSGAHALVTPYGPLDGLSPVTGVRPSGGVHTIEVGDHLLGRSLDGLGRPVDGLGPLGRGIPRPVMCPPPDPFKRTPIHKPFASGVRAIDALTTLGEGQRIGIFAAAGVGKSTLMGMLARNGGADVNVIALVGERGREVRDFIEHVLGAEGLARSVLVIATSDRPAMERLKCAMVATCVAEHFRSQGKHVLLLVDSLTRFARAQREVGLAAGEPPTRRGFPPSLFTALPRLLERTGVDGNGAITAFYTVLTEGEDLVDPVGEEVRSLLDGHIVLSKAIAAQGRFPAIDVLQSNSRLMLEVAPERHVAAARRFTSLLAKYQEIEFLIQVGEYKQGEDRLADEAVAKIDRLRAFLAQPTGSSVAMSDTVRQLNELVGA